MSAAACLSCPCSCSCCVFFVIPFSLFCDCLSIPYLLSCQGRRLLVFDALMRSDHCQAPAVRGSGRDQDQDIKDQAIRPTLKPPRERKGTAPTHLVSGAHGAVLGGARAIATRLRRRVLGFVSESCRPGARPGGGNAQQRLSHHSTGALGE